MPFYNKFLLPTDTEKEEEELNKMVFDIQGDLIIDDFIQRVSNSKLVL